MKPYTKEDDERFSILVIKHAKGTATEIEMAELERLQKKWRHDFNVQNPDYVRAERNTARRHKRLLKRALRILELSSKIPLTAKPE